ncbi:MAG: 3-coathanger stack domain-containing protein [Ferruginibacter sp.]
MKKIIFYLAALVFLNSTAAFSQQDSVLGRQLQGKQNYKDIMNVVDAYFKDPETTNRLGQAKVNRALKQWKRWDWYMSSRLGPNGEFVNINQKMIDATGVQQNRKLQTENGFSNLSQITSGNWSLVGPTALSTGIGRVDRLVFHPADANTVFAGSAGGGLWRTTNAGANWTNLTPDIPCQGISGIALDPGNNNILYILTGDGDSNGPTGALVKDFGYMRLSTGVLKSTNGGANWLPTGIFPGADYSTLVSYRLTMHPTNPDILFACTNQGIFRTADGGTTWNLVEDRGMFFNLKFKPGSSMVCYTISMDAGISRFFKSTDGGNTFIENAVVTNQINTPTARSDIAVAQSNSSVVYILCGGVPNPAGFFKGLYRSDDSGDSFTNQGTTPNILGNSNTGNDNNSQSWYDLSIAVSNTTSNTVATGGVFVWRSLDAGNNWAFRGGTHSDIHELGYHPVDNKLWAATDGGVYSSTDNGANWTAHLTGMSISQLYRMAVNPDNYVDMLGGLQDNGAISRDNGTSTFGQINNSDGFTVAYDGADTSVYYAIINRGIVRFTNSGANANAITPNINNNPFASTMATHPTAANTVYFATTAFWRSTNAVNANNWTVVQNVQGGWAMRSCPSNSNRIYMAGGAQFNSQNGVLRRSDDAGVNWPNTNILSDSFPVTTFPKITYINVNPVNSNRVWITFGGFTDNLKVYYSPDAGLTWFNRSGTLPNVPVNCIVADNNSNVYAGTDNGVYYRGANMSDWVPFYNNLPYVPVTDLVISAADNKLRASTFGRGIWESDLYSDCEANLNITGTLEGQEFYEASASITSTALLSTTAGTKVQMRAGNEVVLQPGFTARENTQFRAMTGPCGSGGVAGYLITDTTERLPVARYLPPADGKRAWIQTVTNTNREVHFEVHQVQDGKTVLVLTDEAGNITRNKNIVSSKKGVWNNSISTAGLKPGTYFLQIILDKRVEHMQEVIVD